GLGMGRVIARPFVGAPGAFVRTSNRHDYAMPPVAETLLDRVHGAGMTVTAVGKVSDLFAGRGVTTAIPTASDDHGVDELCGVLDSGTAGLVLINLVDFDTKYGHRNDVEGYAANLERFDARLGDVLARVRPDDVLVITADHGNDPTTPSTDHSREYVPLLALTGRQRSGRFLGTRASFADLAQTLAAHFGVGAMTHGESFLDRLG
ncbi:MAG TPA: phosphopentomutase, partial [Vicinamibacterales bacterium]|nr:phosphopentomutase [Vicinamibacterales bacterium]